MTAAQQTRLEPVDVVVGLALTLALQVEIWAPGLVGAEESLVQRPVLSLLSLGISLPLIARRIAPWPAGLTGLTAESLLGQTETPPEGLANLAAMLLIAYSLGRYAPRPWGYVGIVPVLVCAMTLGQDAADRSFVAIVLGGAWAGGTLVGRRSDDIAGLERAHRASEQQRLLAAREGAEAERHRIASELHDVVAHRVSMIVVQSQAADALLDGDPGAARRAVRSVEDAARQALAELRQVVGVLAEIDTPTPASTDLARLGDLVDDAKGAGVPVTYEVGGVARAVAPVVTLAVFRIVQESLSNVARHADGATTRVRLEYRDGAVRVSVENEGPVVDPPVLGHGLSGMAERASFVGGTLEAGPRTEGGFRVVALLPTAEATP